MPRRIEKKARGVFERAPGSDIWWIRYKIDGVERREKVGRRGDAIKLYSIRKADALRGIKLPKNMKSKGIRFKVIAQEAVAWYESHDRKDVRNFKSRMSLILESFGEQIADEIKPSEIDTWLGAHDWSPATKNRYKNVFGKTFQVALADGKVTKNPARLVEQRAENNARIRYLLDDEERALRLVIRKRFPEHMEEFDIALNTGMRKGEQYTLEWPEVRVGRKRIHLDRTKNGSNREIPMNKTCVGSFEALHARRTKGHHSARVFAVKDSRSWFEVAVTEAGIRNLRWHDLRHTFISRLVMKGVDLRTVQELAGHKTISMTVRYAHLAPEHNQAAIEKLDPVAA
jgi:site-specific recombinase XerD